MNEFGLIVGMALVTVAVRYPVLALLGKVDLPQPIFRALRYVPPAVLAAIILPAALYPDGEHLNLHYTNAHLVAAIVTALVAWRSKNLLLTIIIGMASLWLWRWLLGAGG